MQIFIRLADGITYSLQVFNDFTLMDVKKRMFDRLGAAVYSYQCKILKQDGSWYTLPNDKTLESLNIRNGQILYMIKS